MKRLIAALACALASASLAGSACAATIYGVNEDQPKFANDDGATIYGQLRDVGLRQNVLSLQWQAAAPTAIADADRIGRAIAAAQARGVKVILAVYPASPTAVSGSGPDGFISFCGQVAAAFPTVDTFIVGNEPNQPRFWRPQFNADGTNASAASFLTVLAGCYDRFHAAGKKVIGGGLSPRGNDDPNAVSNISTSPVRFIRALGAAYRASGRSAPIMDAFSFHPYPNLNNDAPAAGYRWPNIGVPNMDRLKQALYDAFNGTAQPTVEDGLLLDLDEVGWQVDTNGLAGYTGAENVDVVDAATQGRYHAEVVRRSACDPAIESLNFFHWIDESDRDRFQSGEYLADGATKRQSYDDIKAAIADTAGGTRCPAPFQQATWAHAVQVVNPSVDFGGVKDKPAAQTSFALSASADENANADFALVQVSDGNALTEAEKSAIRAQLEDAKVVSRAAALPNVVVEKQQLVKAYFHPRLQLVASDLDRGYYVYAVRLAAEANPGRTAFFVSTPFQAGKGALAGGTKVNLAATTGLASRVLLESALLNGSVKAPKGTRLDAWFEYGPGTSLGRKTPVQHFTGSEPRVSAQLLNLSPRARWSYRLVVRLRGKLSALAGQTRAFTLTRSAFRTVPLVLVGDVAGERGGIQVEAVVSATGNVDVALKVRRLPGGGKAGDATFRRVDGSTQDAGAAGRDLFLTLEAAGLEPGSYLGQVVATSRGRGVVRVLRFTVR